MRCFTFTSLILRLQPEQWSHTSTGRRQGCGYCRKTAGRGRLCEHSSPHSDGSWGAHKGPLKASGPVRTLSAHVSQVGVSRARCPKSEGDQVRGRGVPGATMPKQGRRHDEAVRVHLGRTEKPRLTCLILLGMGLGLPHGGCRVSTLRSTCTMHLHTPVSNPQYVHIPTQHTHTTHTE